MKNLTVTIIQSDLHWQSKDANLQMFEQKIKSIDEPTQLIVLPEMFTTGFTMEAQQYAETMEGPTVQWMTRVATENNIVLCGSIIVVENQHYYNRFIWMQPNGTYGVYDKRHLFAFAGEHKEFNAGNKKLITQINNVKINCNICYDLRFPVWVRQSNQEHLQYDLLLYVANWPAKRSTAWKTLLQARAIENQCFVIGVNRVGEDGNGHLYNGDSMIINPLGEILYHKEKEEDVFTIELLINQISEIRSQIPFLKDADNFEIIL
jgi:omega-amidase